MKQVYSEIPKGVTDQPLFGPSTTDVERLEDLARNRAFRDVINLPIIGLMSVDTPVKLKGDKTRATPTPWTTWEEKQICPPEDSVYKKPQNHLLVIRDYRAMEIIKELKHVLMDTADNSRCYAGQYLDIPVIDMEAMLQYLCSDLDKMIAGEMSVSGSVTQYVLTEVLDHDAEFTVLLRSVMDLVQELLQVLCRTVLEHPIDHYAPHRYELQEVLPSGGVVLRRFDL